MRLDHLRISLASPESAETRAVVTLLRMSSSDSCCSSWLPHDFLCGGGAGPNCKSHGISLIQRGVLQGYLTHKKTYPPRTLL